MFLLFFRIALGAAALLLGFTHVAPLMAAITSFGFVAKSALADYMAPKAYRSLATRTSALFEALSVTILACSLHQMPALGLVALVPLVLRFEALRSDMAVMSGIVAAMTFFGSWSVTSGVVPTAFETLSALSIAGVGFALSRLTPAPQISTPRFVDDSGQLFAFPDEQKILEYRESYRRLKGMYDGLLRRSDSDRASMCLVDWRFSDNRSLKELAHALRNAAEVDGAAIYTVPDSKDGMVLAGASGSAPAEVRTLQVPTVAAPIIIREKATSALKAIREPGTQPSENVVLLDRGKVVGLAVLYDDNEGRIEHGRRVLEDMCPLLAKLLRDEHDMDAMRARTARAELLADLGTRYLDSTREEASVGIVEDLLSNLRLAGCAVLARQNGRFETLSHAGITDTSHLNALMLGSANGVDGWAEAGARELVIPEAREDIRYDRLVAIRSAVGMLAMFPMFSAGSLRGVLVAWTEEAHGMNATALATLRATVPHILRRCFGSSPSTRPGLVDFNTFMDQSQRSGSFVELDLGRSAGSSEVLQLSRKKLLAVAVSRLPQGGMMMRTVGGTLVVFLAGLSEVETKTWVEGLEPNLDKGIGMSVKILGHDQQSIQFLAKVPA